MQTYELQANFDSRASFYGKARIEEQPSLVKLISYTTHVATIFKDPNNLIGGNKVIVKGLYSATTTRHIKEFLKQHGFKADSSKQIVKDYVISQPIKTHQADFAS